MGRNPPCCLVSSLEVTLDSCTDRPLLDDPVELWAARNAATAAFADQRLNQRLAKLLDALGRNPHATIPQACEQWADTKAAYRFLENDRVTVDGIIQPIADATCKLCGGLEVVYAVQDTTSLNYSALAGASGLGPLNDSPRARGIHLHSTLALRADGTPLGLLDQQFWTRPVDQKTAKDRKNRPFEEKESYKWFRGVVSARLAMQNNLSSDERPRLVHVMDREGDVHEVLQMIGDSGDGAVIRSVQNRTVAGEISKAHESVREQPLLGRATIDVPRKSNQAARSATVEFRVARLTITPNRSKYPDRQPCTWTLLEVWEPDPPEGATALRWLLWTTDTITSVTEALATVTIYTYRWRIEEFHLVLKSGCHIEKLELQTVDRLCKAAALYSCVAVRVLALRDLGRREPDAPCTCLLAGDEWRALWTHFKKIPPACEQTPPTLRQATLWIGRLGGHLGRKSDGMPGVRTLWRGVRALALLAAGYRAGRR